MFVRITKHLLFSAIEDGAVTQIAAYEQQVEAWLLRPAATLAGDATRRDTDAGIALLALELMFFEPHGQYLLGTLSDGGSKACFCAAFQRFLAFTTRRGVEEVDRVAPELFYRWARCGLFHSATLHEELLVDALGSTGKWIAPNPVFPGWLVNPWLLLPLIRGYLVDYVTEVRENPDATIAQNFHTTFERLVVGPMRALAAKER